LRDHECKGWGQLQVATRRNQLSGQHGKSSAILRRQLEYRLVLPLFEGDHSAYRWSLVLLLTQSLAVMAQT